MDSTSPSPSQPSRSGLLCVVSGPSGSGKTTLCHKMEAQGGCDYSISCTTRAPRGGEVDGEDYHFLSRDEFESKIEAGEFLEYAEVHGRYYGTLKSSVLDNLQSGIDVLMDLDVQGGENIRACQDPDIQRALVDVFILPPSIDELMDRLRGRGTENADQLELRMENAIAEMKHWPTYQYTIISGTQEADFSKFQALIETERMRSHRMHIESSSP